MNESVSAGTPRRLVVAAELLLLGAIWGGSFLFMRVAAPEFGPFALVEVRLLFGVLALLPFLWHARRRLAGHWRAITAIGLLSSGVPFVLFAWATAVAPAAISAIANSLTALFAVLIAWWMFGERIGPFRSAGLVAGGAGVVLLVGLPAAGVSAGWAALAATIGALCYAVAVNLIRRHLAGLPPVAVGAAALLTSAIVLLPLAVWQWPAGPVSAKAWGSVILLGVLCTGVAYAFFFRLLERIGPSRASTVTYLVPLFGIGWAWAVLGEPLTPIMLVAGLLILGGVGLSQLRPPRPRIAVEACPADADGSIRRPDAQR